MVIEHFRTRAPKPIYRRLREGGRKMPPGLTFSDSWVEPNFDRCFQLMETEDARLLQILPVVRSLDTRQDVEELLDAGTSG